MSKEKCGYFDYKKMGNKAMNCCILICVITCCFFHTALGDIVSKLEVYPGVFKEITLPYKYKYLTPEEISKTGLVLERCYTTLKADDHNRQFVIIGPLKPCIGIGLYYDHKAVVAHVHFSNDVSDFINEAKKELGISGKTDPKEIFGFIYTCRTKNYSDSQFEISSFSTWSWKKKYEGRTQDQEVEKIKTEIRKSLNIVNEKQIETKICESKYTDEAIGWFPYAEFYVLVTLSPKGMDVYNTCMLHEEVLYSGFQEFGKKYSFPKVLLPGAKMMISRNLSDLSNDLSKDEFKEFDVIQKNTYGKIPFKQMPELLSDIGCPGKIDEEQFKKTLCGCSDIHSCANCLKSDNVSMCSGCKEVYYCSRECQKKDWPSHKGECKKK